MSDTEETAQGPSELDILDQLLGGADDKRVVALVGEINTEVAIELVTSLVALDEESDEPIIIWIASPGGAASAGFMIYDVIKMLRSKVITIGMGMVASAGLLVHQAGTYRLALPHTRFFHHQPVMGGGGEILTPQMAEQLAGSYKWARTQLLKVMRTRNIPDDVWNDHFLNATALEFGAKSALEWDLIDRVVTKPKELMYGKPR